MTQNFINRKIPKRTAKLIREEIKQLPEYQKLISKCYREPSGYTSHRAVCYEIAHSIWNARVSPKTLDWVAANSASIAYQVAHLELPTLWLSKPLAIALNETNTPTQIAGLRRVLPGGIIMLPENLFKTPDDQPCTFIAWIHRLPEDEVIDINLGPKFTVSQSPIEQGQICWFSALANRRIYSGNVKCLPDEVEFGAIDLATNLRYFTDIDEEAESDIIASLQRLIIQTLLVMQARPDLVDETHTRITQGAGFKKPKVENQMWNPRWIGKNYVIREETVSAPPSGGTHASPRPHWRKGHNRRVPFGPREENQRKWIWLEPTLVYPQHTT
ncbi:hypothetical protein [Chlorogloea sp. CCALA 695]|uniref:hypothetical protein n=1 Tax=Chlorogloea sp. CCALA 695 TaxID=2107693 RepID=UPI000D0484AA|nr:hypothetical protein [Chlorogloea sp. CCALA 695]PSB26127.1 hypothetical protein C7B70_24255 [Chlorogloea sp. CCALA 695]